MRGRGSLEVNPLTIHSSSAHLGTSASPEEHVEWKAALNPDFAASLKMKRSENFSFLYTRESDNIGAKVDNPLDSKPRVLTKTEFLKKWRAERTKDLDLMTVQGGR